MAPAQVIIVGNEILSDRLFAGRRGAMAQPARWTEKAANEWYAKQPWLVGSNYMPATAINQLEMWQAETFDPVWIDTELDVGRGSRHEHDARVPARPAVEAGLRRASGGASTSSSAIADKHKIKPIFVLFDSCWDPYPQLGHAARAEARRAQFGLGAEPGRDGAAGSEADYERLRQYVQGVVGAFRYDKRVLAWDLWNEPDNTNDSSYGSWSRRTRCSWCWRCCRRCSRGRARCAAAAADQRRVEGRLVERGQAERRSRRSSWSRAT